jgi:hypothetical protein
MSLAARGDSRFGQHVTPTKGDKMNKLRKALAIATLAASTIIGVAAPAHAATPASSCVSRLTAQVDTIYASTNKREASLTPSTPAVTRDIVAECNMKVTTTHKRAKLKSTGTPPGMTMGPRAIHSTPGLYTNIAGAELCALAVAGGCLTWHAGMIILFDSDTAATYCTTCNSIAWQGLGWSNTYFDPDLDGGTGFTVTVTDHYWAGENPATYNEYTGATNGPLTATTVVTVSFLFYGFPISDSHTMTVNCYPLGQTSVDYA